jgi:hypothetical protein
MPDIRSLVDSLGNRGQPRTEAIVQANVRRAMYPSGALLADSRIFGNVCAPTVAE